MAVWAGVMAVSTIVGGAGAAQERPELDPACEAAVESALSAPIEHRVVPLMDGCMPPLAQCGDAWDSARMAPRERRLTVLAQECVSVYCAGCGLVEEPLCLIVSPAFDPRLPELWPAFWAAARAIDEGRPASASDAWQAHMVTRLLGAVEVESSPTEPVAPSPAPALRVVLSRSDAGQRVAVYDGAGEPGGEWILPSTVTAADLAPMTARLGELAAGSTRVDFRVDSVDIDYATIVLMIDALSRAGLSELSIAVSPAE